MRQFLMMKKLRVTLKKVQEIPMMCCQKYLKGQKCHRQQLSR